MEEGIKVIMATLDKDNNFVFDGHVVQGEHFCTKFEISLLFATEGELHLEYINAGNEARMSTALCKSKGKYIYFVDREMTRYEGIANIQLVIVEAGKVTKSCNLLGARLIVLPSVNALNNESGKTSSFVKYVEDAIKAKIDESVAIALIDKKVDKTQFNSTFNDIANELALKQTIVMADKDKAELNGKISLKADKSAVFTKLESDNKYAKSIDTYTKIEVDNLLSQKADTLNVYAKNEVFSKSETNALLANKIDTISAYSKLEVDEKIGAVSDLVKGLKLEITDYTPISINTIEFAHAPTVLMIAYTVKEPDAYASLFIGVTATNITRRLMGTHTSAVNPGKECYTAIVPAGYYYRLEAPNPRVTVQKAILRIV